MPLQIRRGLEENLPNSPADGELLYATDSGKLYIGYNGVVRTVLASDFATVLFEDKNPALGANLDLNGFKITSSANGDISLDPDGSGKVNLIAATTVTGGLTVVGNVDFSGYAIVSSNNGNITLDPNGVGTINLHSNVNVNGTLNMYNYAITTTQGNDLLLSPTDAVVRTTTGMKVYGPLEVVGYAIVSSNNSNVMVQPDGTGKFVVNAPTGSAFNGNVEVDGTITSPTGENVTLQAGSGGNITLGSDIVITGSSISKTGSLNITATGELYIGSATAPGDVVIQREGYSSATTAGFLFKQAHSSVDAVNFSFYRTRGTIAAPTALQVGDQIADIIFAGHDGTGSVIGGGISVEVADTVVAGRIPTKFTFSTDNGTNIGVRAELTQHGALRIDNITGYTGTNVTVPRLISDVMTLTPSTVAPSSPVAGMIAMATGSDSAWDPLGIAPSNAYPVFYNGMAWVGF